MHVHFYCTGVEQASWFERVGLGRGGLLGWLERLKARWGELCECE